MSRPTLAHEPFIDTVMRMLVAEFPEMKEEKLARLAGKFTMLSINSMFLTDFYTATRAEQNAKTTELLAHFNGVDL